MSGDAGCFARDAALAESPSAASPTRGCRHGCARVRLLATPDFATFFTPDEKGYDCPSHFGVLGPTSPLDVSECRRCGAVSTATSRDRSPPTPARHGATAGTRTSRRIVAPLALDQSETGESLSIRAAASMSIALDQRETSSSDVAGRRGAAAQRDGARGRKASAAARCSRRCTCESFSIRAAASNERRLLRAALGRRATYSCSAASPGPAVARRHLVQRRWLSFRPAARDAAGSLLTAQRIGPT